MGGSLTEDEIKTIKDNEKYYHIENFVETGTYKCDTTMLAAKNFKKVFTTEIVKKLYEDAQKIAHEFNNISFLFGDSVELLNIIMPQITEGSIFFLDAHQSGPDTGNNNKQLVPLIEEINTILSYKLGPSIFILDDLRFWKGKELSSVAFDWDHISTSGIIQNFITNGKNIVDFYEKNDRFWVFTD